jgi:hypothetical protein
MRIAFGLTLVALTFAGCFSPNLEGVSFVCDESNPQCPAGYTCTEGRCVQGSGTSMMEPPTSTVDGGSGNAGAAGCSAGVGFDVSKDVARPTYACPGTFQNDFGNPQRNVNRLCAAGYAVCTDANRVNLSACNQITTGYFVARVDTRRQSGMTDVQCGTPNGTYREELWAGCGRTSKEIFQANCSGFTSARDCDPMSTFFCMYKGWLETATNTDPNSGALCCKQ